MPKVSFDETSFFSGPGVRLASRVYRPSTATDRKAGIVFCHGFGGTKEGTPPGMAQLFAEHGFTVLSFDYRGFGGSEGGHEAGWEVHQPNRSKDHAPAGGVQHWIYGEALRYVASNIRSVLTTRKASNSPRLQVRRRCSRRNASFTTMLDVAPCSRSANRALHTSIGCRRRSFILRDRSASGTAALAGAVGLTG